MKYIIPNIIDGKFVREDGTPIQETPREAILRAMQALLFAGRPLNSLIRLRSVDENKSTEIELYDLDNDPDEPKQEKVTVIGLQPEILEAHLAPVACGASNSPDPDVVEWVNWFASKDALINSRLQGCAVAVVSEFDLYNAACDVEYAFSYHPPCGTQVDRYKVIRDCGGQFAEVIGKLCPPSQERDTAIVRLRETVMWANAAIACNEDNTGEKSPKDGIKEQIELAKKAWEEHNKPAAVETQADNVVEFKPE